MRILHKIICCLVILLHIHAGTVNVLALRPVASKYTHILSLTTLKDSCNISVNLLLPGEQRQFSIEIPIDFHERVRWLDSFIANIRDGAADKERFGISFSGIAPNEAQLLYDDFKTIWQLYGYAYDNSTDKPFMMNLSERQIRAKKTINAANNDMWSLDDILKHGANRLPALMPGEKPRILIVSSSARDDVVLTNKKGHRLISPNFGHHRIKAFLEAKDIAMVDVFNPEVYSNSDTAAIELVAMMQNRQYHIVGISPTHSNLINDLRLTYLLKKISMQANDDKRPIFIAGGNEATYGTETLLKHAPFDAVIRGYGEQPMARLCQLISGGDRRNLQDIFKDIKGMAHKGAADAEAAIMTPEEFREYSFTYFPYANMPYRQHWIYSALSMDPANLAVSNATLRCVRMFFTTHCAKGIPCGFCSNWLAHKQKLLGLNAQEMVELVEKAVNIHGAEAIFLNDDDVLMGGATIGIKRFKQFLTGIIQKKKSAIIPADLCFYMQTRSLSFLKRDQKFTPDKELVSLMKEAGFVMVSIGIENLSNRLLLSQSINKFAGAELSQIQRAGLAPLDIHERAINTLLEAGITPQLNLVGLPPEATIDDLMENIRKSLNYVHLGAQLALSSYIWYLPGAALARSEEYKTHSLEIVDKYIPGTNILYQYPSRYKPNASDEIKHITDEGTIWGQADKVWEKLCGQLQQEGFAITLENQPLQIRVLAIFASELELLSNLLESRGRQDKADDLNRLSEEIKTTILDIMRRSSPAPSMAPRAVAATETTDITVRALHTEEAIKQAA